MSYLRTVLCLLCFAALLLVWGWLCRPAELRFLLPLQADYQAVLSYTGQDFQWSDEGLLRWRNPSSAVLQRLYWFERLGMQTCLLNVANAQTVKTADGIPYQRRLTRLLADGHSEWSTDNSDFNWVYDPTNPDAVQEGEKKGYVAMPNVNVEAERSHYELHRSRAELWARALQRVDPNLLIPQGSFEPEALPVNFGLRPQELSFQSMLQALQPRQSP